MFVIESNYKALNNVKCEDPRELVVSELTKLDVPAHRIRFAQHGNQMEFVVKFSNNAWLTVARAFAA